MPRRRQPAHDLTVRSTRPSSRPARGDALDCFAVAAPGIESIVAAELAELGIRGVAEPGGVSWRGGETSLARANLWLRTASRVLVRVAEFHARSFFELERHASRITWERWLAPGAAVRFRVTSRKSRLYHTEAIAQRLMVSAAKRAGAVAASRGVADEEREADDAEAADGPAADEGQLVVVRAMRDLLTISVDSSGAHLHRRGYRQALGKAPLRETLAAAMLLGAGWRGDVPLVDPLCGSGTIPIEAALIARRIAPGLQRDFAFTQWPDSDPAVWQRALAEARKAARPGATVPIRGSDRDAGAIEAARANAERAGVTGDIGFATIPLSAAGPPERSRQAGLIVTNPPYGVRIGDARALRDLYAQLGNLLRGPFAGWRIALLSPSPELHGQMGVRFEERFRTTNGGIGVVLLTGR